MTYHSDDYDPPPRDWPPDLAGVVIVGAVLGFIAMFIAWCGK